MKIIITAVGSVGDVHPFLAVARSLKRHTSHDIVVIANEKFRTTAEADGIAFHAHGTKGDYEQSFTPPDNLGNPFVFLKKVGELTYYNFFKPIQPTFELIKTHRTERTLLIAHGVSFGARLARDAFRIPLVSGILSPVSVPGNGDPGFGRVMQKIGETLCKNAINKFCRENNLPAITKVDGWSLSPDKILALFPDFMEKDPSSWPAHVAPVGYQFHDGPGHDDAVEKIRSFIADDPAILFTCGTPVRTAFRLFREAVAICRALRRKGIFITDYPGQVPDPLPDFITYRPYAPFHRVFPLCEAIVHHGGIGTIMQGLRAGKPQLLVTHTADQPSNARRLRDLMLADSVSFRKFNAEVGTEKLRRLITDPSVRERCLSWSRRIREDNTEKRLLESLEPFLTGRSVS